MNTSDRAEDIRRIYCCFDAVMELMRKGNLRTVIKYGCEGDPTTAFDREINELIYDMLPSAGEGWLSEESKDTTDRFRSSRVWIVDPIDGTREFLEGVPEWSVSIGLVEENKAVAGGVLNPETGEMFLGSMETGLRLNRPAKTRTSTSTTLLVSRREHRLGKWKGFQQADIEIVPTGSIAYRLALVAAGHADATCTFEERNEWDVAAGVALVHAAEGRVVTSGSHPVYFNRQLSKVKSLFACGKSCPDFLQQACGVSPD